MQSKRNKNIAAVLILILTVAIFVWYLSRHHSVIGQIRKTPVHLIILLLILYLGTVVAVGFTLYATLLLCNLKLHFKEVILITVYSSVINFFGPLQSGPVFRAIYLKKKHHLKLKNYSLATMIYYLMYATFSGIFLVSSLLKWWLMILAVLGIILVYLFFKSNGKLARQVKELHLKGLGVLTLATFLQVVLLSVIYYIEVHFIDPHVSYSQVIIYTGAANFSLFVSLTPGAIGFREAFLVFSRKLHHISLSTIVAANVIDRCVYVLMLIILVIFIFTTHLSDKLRNTTESDKPLK